MPHYELHIDLEFDGLNLIGFPPSADPQLQCSIRCLACTDLKTATFSLSDAHESEDGRTMLHYSATCKCKSPVMHKMWLCPLKPLIKPKDPLPYISEHFCQIGTSGASDDDDDKAKPTTNTLFAVIEARGCELVSYEVINTEWVATDGKSFYTVGDLTTDGYYDVNNNDESMSVTLLKYRVQ